MVLLRSGGEGTGKERVGGVIAEGLKYGKSWTKKEAKLVGDSETGLCQRGSSLEVVMK